MDQHVVVTGGSRGLGLAIANQLLSTGYSVTTVSRTRTTGLDDLVKHHSGKLRIIQADLSAIDQLPALLNDITSRCPIFGIINNAAIAVDGLLVSISAEEIERMVATNVTATILLSRLASKHMIRSRGGRIINISSIAANRAYRGLAAYSSTKAAIEGLTRTLAYELGPRGITVNAVAPGFLETDMSATLTVQQIEQIKRRTPLGALVTAEDVAQLVTFLLSPAARMITGTVVNIDGGASL